MTQLPPLGDLLRRYRVVSGQSQEALAERAGLSARSISDLERGVNLRPHHGTIDLLAEALELSPQSRATLEAAVTHRRRPRTAPSSPAETPAPMLPSEPTPLLGRAQDVAAVCALFARPGVRLVTLTGPGGVGKTRLALRVAQELRDHLAVRVRLVALASVGEPGLVAPAIARAIGLSDAAGQPTTEALTAYLADRDDLLLLDNFEQVVAAAPLVAALLAACPRLMALVTSRAALRVRAEYDYALAPLAVPPSAPHSGVPGARAWLDYAAVDLFVQRARAVKPRFELAEADAPVVADICRRLDGLPLAIELAAARVKVLSPRALHARLTGTDGTDGTGEDPARATGSTLQLLADGPRDLPARQQTLRAAMAWSYDLLSPPEQTLFRRLGVFVGGCTADAADAVCVARLDGDETALATPDAPDASDVLPGLASLVDNSLLRQEEEAGDPSIMGDARFALLRTVQEYARERLEASGERETVRRRHAAYYLALAEQAEPQLYRADQRAWQDRLETEHGNLRAALRWSVAEGEGEPDIGLRLAGALWRFWWQRGYLSEGRRWLTALLEATAAAPPDAARARALHGAARLAYGQGDYAPAAILADQSLALSRAAGSASGSAAALSLLGIIAMDQGQYERAVALTEESLALFQRIGNAAWAGTVLSNLGIIAAEQGDYAGAAVLYERSLTVQRDAGDLRGIAVSQVNLARLEREQGNFARASALYEESVALFRDLGGKHDLAAGLNNLGEMARLLGDFARAAALSEESVALQRELGDKRGLGMALADLAHVARHQGDGARALALYEEAMSFCQAVGNRLGLAQCLEGMAATLFARGQPRRTVLLYGAAAMLRDAINTPMAPADRRDHDPVLANARVALSACDAAAGQDPFAAAWEQEQALTVEDIMAMVAAMRAEGGQ